MFYVAEALLPQKNLAYSKHSAVHAAFGEHFTKTGIAPSEFHRYLKDAQDLRLAGDYGMRHSVTADQARKQITRAESLLGLAEEFLKSP